MSLGSTKALICNGMFDSWQKQDKFWSIYKEVKSI